jgi:hypothetical protein
MTTPDYLSGDQLCRDIAHYAQFGEHRTGTPVDRRTGEWLADRLARAGLRAEVRPWTVRQFLLDRCEMHVAGEPIECFPLWFPRATGPRPLSAPLAMFESDQPGDFPAGQIAIASLPPTHEVDRPLACERLVAAATAAGASALLIGTAGPSGDIYAFNQEHLEPLPLPTALVAPRDWPRIAAAAASRATATLLITGEDNPSAQTGNVLGHHDGGQRTIVVSTPATGWFACAGERGPGVALFLALARWVAERRPPVRYVFTANAGHELGNRGMQQLLASGILSPEHTIGWLHLGASIGTVGWGQIEGQAQARTLGATPDLLPLLAAAFADLPHLATVPRPLGGEMPYVIAAGYRSIAGIAGRFPAFHTRADRPDTATRPDLMEPIALALTRFLASLEQI